MKEYADSIISVIRSYDPTRVVICGMPNLNRDLDAVAADPLKHDNVIYGVSLFSGNDESAMRSKIESLREKKLPFFVSEFSLLSSSGSTSIDEKEAETMITWMNENKISWANTQYSDAGEATSMLNKGACTTKDWSSVTNYGEFIKAKLQEKNPFESCVDGVEDVPFADLIGYYPNPVENEFSVVLPDGVVADGVRIFDFMGRMVYETNAMNMNLSMLTPGVYYVKVIFPEGVSVKKILKQ